MLKKEFLDLIKPYKIGYEFIDNNIMFANVIAEPLERGMGTTLGVSLRRVLLSCLRGAAVIGLQIYGIKHEFSYIDGVLEDITEIILNLKSLVLKKYVDGISKLFLVIKGPCLVTADFIKRSDEVEVLNPNLVICTLTKDVELNMELSVDSGFGYFKNFDLDKINFPIGYIPLDAVFTPIKKVSFKVENVRIGQRTDYEKLVLGVYSNGSVSPIDAVSIASFILQDQLDRFIVSEQILGSEFVDKAYHDSDVNLDKNLFRKIDELELSVRVTNCFKSNGIKYIGELVQKTESDLLLTPNFGRKSLNEIKEILSKMGLSLGMKVFNWKIESPEGNF